MWIKLIIFLIWVLFCRFCANMDNLVRYWNGLSLTILIAGIGWKACRRRNQVPSHSFSTLNPHQYTLRNLLIRTPGVHVDPSSISSFMIQVHNMLSQKWFNYLRQDVLWSIVFIGWLVCWCVYVGVFVSMFVCSLTCFGAEYLENDWS